MSRGECPTLRTSVVNKELYVKLEHPDHDFTARDHDHEKHKSDGDTE